MICKKCKDPNKGKYTYIGETGRMLKLRVKEHLYHKAGTVAKSDVSNHAIEIHGEITKKDWEVRVLDRETDEFKELRKRLE